MALKSQFNGDLVDREQPCTICREKTGRQIGIVDYWDIKTSNVVLCEKCRHIQLDPMLNGGETAKGCLAYYIEEFLRTSREKQFKNCERNFRRGVVFGYQLKLKQIFPQSVLELGPGSGYFAAGLQFAFLGIGITVMDINPEVLNFNHEQHGFETIRENPDNFTGSFENRFDLVIARDILEHVNDISKVVENVHAYLKPNGLFHFITPNGREDIWKHYLSLKFGNAPSELLINHVNYFDGKGLKNLLTQKGFSAVDYHTYTFKTTLRGLGWKESKALMSPASRKTQADLFIQEKAGELKRVEFIKEKILDKWYIRPGARWITGLYSLVHHFSMLRLSPERNIGHEIYGLYKKSGSKKIINHDVPSADRPL